MNETTYLVLYIVLFPERFDDRVHKCFMGYVAGALLQIIHGRPH